METILLEELLINKKTPCVSIIVPTNKTSPERTVDPLEIRHAVENAKELLTMKYGTNGNGAGEVLATLDKITSGIDFIHNGNGIGLFAAPGMSKVIKFPFPVTEKIIIGENFEIRDLVYMEEYLSNYYVLAINEKALRLYKGEGEHLKEVWDHNFPIEIKDDYIYEKPSQGTSFGNNALKNPEKDKSIIKENRLMAELKKADKKLSHYLGENTPLIPAGINKEVGYFMKITTHEKYIAGKVEGNYLHEGTLNVLGEKAYEEMKRYQEEEENKLLFRLEEAVGRKLVASGIEEVWKAAKEGKGLILLVEKDCTLPGFISSDKAKFYKHPPKTEHEIISDAANDVMEIVLEKQGKVIMVENGKLFEHNGIAMILRY